VRARPPSWDRWRKRKATQRARGRRCELWHRHRYVPAATLVHFCRTRTEILLLHVQAAEMEQEHAAGMWDDSQSQGPSQRMRSPSPSPRRCGKSERWTDANPYPCVRACPSPRSIRCAPCRRGDARTSSCTPPPRISAGCWAWPHMPARAGGAAFLGLASRLGFPFSERFRCPEGAGTRGRVLRWRQALVLVREARPVGRSHRARAHHRQRAEAVGRDP
jgi:hypothetical protein